MFLKCQERGNAKPETSALWIRLKDIANWDSDLSQNNILYIKTSKKHLKVFHKTSKNLKINIKKTHRQTLDQTLDRYHLNTLITLFL